MIDRILNWAVPRVTRGSDESNDTLDFDILYGIDTVHPELARRLIVAPADE